MEWLAALLAALCAVQAVMGWRRRAQLRRVEEQLRTQRAFLDALPGGGCSCTADGTGRLCIVTDGLWRMYGYQSAEDMRGDVEGHLEKLIHPEDRERTGAVLRRQLQGHKRQSKVTHRICTRDGRVTNVYTAAHLVEQEGKETLFILMMENREMADEARALRRMAHRDPVSTLYNRTGIETLAARRFSQPAQGRTFGLMMVDVDHFKQINDRFGHPAGDEAIRMVGRTLRTFGRARDAAGRVGGDEFLILLEDVPGPAELAAIAERLVQALRGIDLGGEAGRCVTGSVGAVLCGPGSDYQACFAQADRALYAAKQAGRDCWRLAGELTGVCTASLSAEAGA